VVDSRRSDDPVYGFRVAAIHSRRSGDARCGRVARPRPAGVSLLAECVNPDPFGPSTVVRYLDHPEMEATATRLVAALGLSGFASFDFVIAEDGGGAFLIELNPRTIGTIHLGRLFWT
jgi:ATP-grasp domain